MHTRWILSLDHNVVALTGMDSTRDRWITPNTLTKFVLRIVVEFTNQTVVSGMLQDSIEEGDGARREETDARDKEIKVI